MFVLSFLLIHLALSKGKLTVGKIYAGLLLVENWKTTRFGKIPGRNALSVSNYNIQLSPTGYWPFLLKKLNENYYIILNYFRTTL